MPRLTTERLVLETLTGDEVAALLSGDRTGRHWAEDYPTEGDMVVAGVIGEAGQYYAENAVLGVYQVRLASTGDAVGGIGFLSAARDGEAEVGYGLARSAQGYGLATEALAAVVELAHDTDVERVVALTEADNLASHGVLRRCGFEREGEVTTDEGPMMRWVHRAASARLREVAEAGSIEDPST